jgi:hypothetical protein
LAVEAVELLTELMAQMVVLVVELEVDSLTLQLVLVLALLGRVMLEETELALPTLLQPQAVVVVVLGQ